jgi:branched-chain amino acid transport system substrate-binding protein
VWAIIGSIDGSGTHLAEQVVVKAMVSLVNPVATDRGIHMAGVPWMFSVVQGDDMHSSLLARALRRRNIVIVSATDHDSRAFSRLLKSGCGREAVSIKLHLEFDPARADLSPLALSAAAVSPEAVVIAASARAGARAVKALRESGFGGAIFGGPWFGRASFAGQSGAHAEGVRFSWVGEPAPDYRRRFAARFGGPPDYAAASAYDSVRIVIAAIREAGLNRARIRDALAKLSPYEGASGRIEWDEFGQNRRPPVLAIIRNGQPVPAPAQPQVR